MATNGNEILKYAIEHNIIDTVDMQIQVENMKREKYLEMHNHKIWENKQGKWFTYLDDESKRGYSLKVRKTSKAIEDLIIKYYKDKEEDPYIGTVFNMWNDQRVKYGEIAVQTYDKYSNEFKRFFTKDCPLCQKKFRQITEEDLELFIKETIRKYDMTAKIYSNLRTVIRGVFKFGKRKKFTELSITTFYGDLDLSKNIFRKKVVKKEEEVFNEDEVNQIIPYLKKRGKIRDLGVLLAFQCGARVGELSTIKKSDITGNKRGVHIQRTEITYKDPETRKSVCEVREYPKSEAGVRCLIITDSALPTLNAILELTTDSEYLFAENGKRIRGNAFNRCLIRACNKVGIPPRSMHKVRKTYGTTLIDNNVDESLIAEQMGHKDITTTKKYYYFSNKNEDTKFEQINRAISC